MLKEYILKNGKEELKILINLENVIGLRFNTGEVKLCYEKYDSSYLVIIMNGGVPIDVASGTYGFELVKKLYERITYDLMENDDIEKIEIE